MKFNAKALLVLVGFAAVVLLAVSARKGTIGMELAFVGVAAILLVELLVTPLGHALWHRLRVFNPNLKHYRNPVEP